MIEITKTIEGTQEEGLIFACNVFNANERKFNNTSVPIHPTGPNPKPKEEYVPISPEEYFDRMTDIMLDNMYAQKIAAGDELILKAARNDKTIRDRIEKIIAEQPAVDPTKRGK